MNVGKIAAAAAVILGVAATALSANDNIQIIPIGNYQTLSTGDTTLHSPGTGLLLVGAESMFVGQYTHQTIDATQEPGDPKRFHAFEALYDTRSGRHRFLSVFSSTSDTPVAGGWHTFQAASVYGYRIVETERTSVTVGGGLAVSDFGIETKGGRTWPVLPVPFIQASYATPQVALTFDFITGPNLNLVLAPERDLQLVADARMDQFRDLHDLLFEIALAYRFLSAGVANNSFSFDLADEETHVDVGSYVVFGKFDLTILTLTAGYAFGGWERRNDDLGTGTGEGFYLAVQALLPIGGGSE